MARMIHIFLGDDEVSINLDQDLDLEPVGHKGAKPLYLNENNFWYFIKKGDGRERRILVPHGRILDGASVPRLGWTISGILPDGLNRLASFIHDDLYRHRGHGMLNRKQCDWVFFQLLLIKGFSRRRSKVAYWAVRVGGLKAWLDDNE